jgi:hypothetical protein
MAILYDRGVRVAPLFLNTWGEPRFPDTDLLFGYAASVSSASFSWGVL